MSDSLICLSNGPGERSASNLEACIDQFKDQLLSVWEPKDGLTWCNHFAQAVTAALQCPLPMALANEQLAWLETAGKTQGWSETTREHAIAHAQGGGPCVVAWRNATPGGHGHIAVLRPIPPAADPEGAPYIAQAGRENFLVGRMVRGFSHLPVRFWVHE